MRSTTPKLKFNIEKDSRRVILMLTSGERFAMMVSLSLLFLLSLLGAEGKVCVPIACNENQKTITRAGVTDVHSLFLLFPAPPLSWRYKQGAGMLSYYFRPKKVVKIFRDHHCDICRRNLKNQYHTELGFIITVRVCSDCRDIKRNFIQYLTSKDVEISIQKIVGWLADMKLLDVKLPLEIPRQIKPNRIFRPKKLAIKMAA
jgi:hypothetical protein